MASEEQAGKVGGANADEAAYWNSEPARKWVENEILLDGGLAGILDRLMRLAAPRAGEAVLDVGCGTGASTLALAAAVAPGGRVTGADISEAQLARARERVAEAGAEGVELAVVDAQTHPFAPGGFDLVASRFGMMFFADPVAAFANIGRGMRPGGRIVFATWAPLEANPWFAIPRAVALARMGPVAPMAPGATGPFAIADLGYGLGLLERAGFTDRRAQTETLALTLACTAEEAGKLATSLGPAVRVLREKEGTPEDAAAIAAAVAEGLAPYAHAGGLEVPGAVNFFAAVRPG